MDDVDPEGAVRRGIMGMLAVSAMLASACAGPVVELEFPALDAVPRDVPEQSVVYDADGEVLAVLRREFRERVSIDDVPRHLVDAVLAAEDQRFFDHGGVDGRAVVRAALRNLAAGRIEEGASTITQQVADVLYLPDAPRTFATKLREALIARRLEDELGKDRILESYLNAIYLGNGAHGVQAAAEAYWRKDVGELTVAEAALLAGLIRAPGSLDPSDAPDAARRRRDQVLDRMVALGTVTPEAAAAAKATPVVVHDAPPRPETREPHWVDLVIRTLLADPTFGATEAERATRLFGGGLHVHTTLRPGLQATARELIADALPADADPDAAIVAVDPATGHVLAAAHAVPYDKLQFDLATQARRQPGSTFKAFVLAAAVSDGRGPREVIDGSPARIPLPDGRTWDVRNYGGADPGLVTLERATARSVNGAFARLVLDLGARRVAGLATAMGVRSAIPPDPQIALGGGTLAVTPLDMAAGYATLASLGRPVPVTSVARIEDGDGRVVWRPAAAGASVLDPGAAYVTTEMLQTVVTSGSGTAARVPGWEVAGKTGTTSDHADAWFVGYTPTLSVAVWVGHASGRIPMRNVQGVPRVTGGSIPARLFRRFATAALDGQTPVPFSLPEAHLETLEIDPVTGLRSAPWCPGEPTTLPRVIAPRRTCPSPTPLPPPSPSPTPTVPTASPEATPGPSPDPRATPTPRTRSTSTPAPEPSPASPPSAPDEPAPSPTATGTGATGGDSDAG